MKMPDPTLHRLLEDVSALRPQLAARRADLLAERAQTDRQHYYAIDTNIIYFLGQPVFKTLDQPKLDRHHRSSFARRGRANIPHIGSIFRSDPLQYHLTIGVSLARFIGLELSGTNPLFLPTALWVEADSMIPRFMDLEDPATLALADDVFDQVVRRTMTALARRLDASEAVLETIQVELRKLVRHKLGREQGLTRLRALLQQGKIDELSSRPILTRSGRSQPLWQLQESQRQLEEDFTSNWDSELRAAGKEGAGHRDLDARALTQIQIRNQFAHQQNSNERVLYLTLDTHVVAAARNIHIDYLNCSFAEAFIRHPAAFLNDIGLGVKRPLETSSAASEEPASILDWLDVLLARTSNRKTTRESDTDDQKDAGRIKDSWMHLSDIREKELFLVLGLDEVGDILNRLADTGDIELTLEHIRAEIIEGEARAWHECFNVAIELALRRNAHHRQEPTRSSPSICFEAWPAAAAAIEEFKLWGFEGVRNRAAFDEGVSRLADAEDKTGYAHYLASAAFFAARGEWRPAAGLSAFARTMAYRHDKAIRGGANGREANYLEAVARRHLARQAADLLRAQELLDECLRIYAEEKLDWPHSNDIVPERFRLEQLDIEQTELMFRWYSDGSDSDISVESVYLFERYGYLQSELSSKIDRRMPGGVIESMPSGENHVLIQTEIRTIVSMLLIFGIDVIPMTPSRLQQVRSALRRFHRLREVSLATAGDAHLARFAPDNSFMAKFIVKAIAFVLDHASQSSIDRGKLRKFREDISSNKLASRATFPFDRKRFDTTRRLMRRIARSSSSSPR